MFEHNQRWKDFLVETYRNAEAREAGITSRVGLDLYIASRELEEIAGQVREIGERIGDDRITIEAERLESRSRQIMEMAKAEPPFGGFVFDRELLPCYLKEVSEEVYGSYEWFVKTNISKDDGIVICANEDDAYTTLRAWRKEQNLDPVTGDRR